jgi:hypothetical protein
MVEKCSCDDLKKISFGSWLLFFCKVETSSEQPPTRPVPSLAGGGNDVYTRCPKIYRKCPKNDGGAGGF